MNDHAAHDILATSLLVALTVVLSGAFAIVVRAQLVPEPRYAADVEMAVLAGPDQAWGTGDEQLRATHAGGESIPVELLVLVLDVNGSHTRHAAADEPALGPTFGIGESWAVSATIARGAQVDASLVLSVDGGSYLLDELDAGYIA